MEKITRHEQASARGCPTLCDTISPSERSRCNHRFVVDCGRPSVVAIFLGCHFSDGEEFLCRSHHNARKMLVNTGFETSDAVVDGFGVSCVGVRRCWRQPAVLSTIFRLGIFHLKEFQIEDVYVDLGPPLLQTTNPRKKESPVPETQGRGRGSRNAKAQRCPATL